MRHLGLFEAKNRLSELVEQGKPVAELGPLKSRTRAKEAADEILGLDWKLGQSAMELIREGRRERE